MEVSPQNQKPFFPKLLFWTITHPSHTQGAIYNRKGKENQFLQERYHQYTSMQCSYKVLYFEQRGKAEISDPYHPQLNDHILKSCFSARIHTHSFDSSPKHLVKSQSGKNKIKTGGRLKESQHIRNINYACIENHRLVISKQERYQRDEFYFKQCYLSLQTQSSVYKVL